MAETTGTIIVISQFLVEPDRQVELLALLETSAEDVCGIGRDSWVRGCSRPRTEPRW